MELTNNAKRMLRAMRADPERTWDLDAILEATDWSDQAHVAGAGGGFYNTAAHPLWHCHQPKLEILSSRRTANPLVCLVPK